MDAPLSFEWDQAKADGNVAKHGVSFDTAMQVFADPEAVDYDVTHEGDGELRRKVVGRVDGRLFAVVYTRRAAALRLISARPTNKTEEKRYGDR